MTTSCRAAALALAALFCTLPACDKSPEPSRGIIMVPDEDPRLAAATAEARRRWPEFLAEFNKHEKNVAYAVKLPFKVVGEEGGSEHMWISVTSVEGNTIKGRLDNEPGQNVGVKLGDEVTTSVEEIEDWMVGRGAGNLRGLFSVPVLEQIKKEQEGKGGG